MITELSMNDNTVLYSHTAWADDPEGMGFSLAEYDGALYTGNYIDSVDFDSDDPERYEWTALEITPMEAFDDNSYEDLLTDMLSDLEEVSGDIEVVSADIEAAQSVSDEGLGNVNELIGTNRGTDGWTAQGDVTLSAQKDSIYADTDDRVSFLTVTCQRSGNNLIFFQAEELRAKLAGDTSDNAYTLSCDIRMSVLFDIPLIAVQDEDGTAMQLRFDAYENIEESDLDEIDLSGAWIHHTSTVSVLGNDDEPAAESMQALYFDLSEMPEGAVLDIANLKIESGGHATAWRESLEELKNRVNEAADTALDARKTAINYLAYNSRGLIVYDGYNGEALPDTVQSYNVFISTEADDASVKIRSGQTVLNKINKKGMIIYGDDRQIASFGKEITLGQPDRSRLVQTDSGLSGRNMNGEEYFFIGQSKGGESEEYIYTVCDSYSMSEEPKDFAFDEKYVYFYPKNTVYEALSVEYVELGGGDGVIRKVNSSELIVDKETNAIKVPIWDPFSGKGYFFWVTYSTPDTLGFPHFTLGHRASSMIGSFSMAAGRENSAVGELSFTFGEGLYADTGQFALGTYNKSDKRDSYVFMIGNGYKGLDENPVLTVTVQYASLPYVKEIDTSLDLSKYSLECYYLDAGEGDYELSNHDGIWQIEIFDTENARMWVGEEFEFYFSEEKEFRSNALTVDLRGRIEIPGEPDSCSWVFQRENAVLKRTGLIEDNAMYPLIDAKTQSGDWAMATYGENLWLSYISDANYKSGTNAQGGFFRVGADGSIAASGRFMSGNNPLFATQQFVLDNRTVAKSSLKEFDVAITKSGYMPVAIAGFDLDNASSSGVNVSSCWLTACRIISSTQALLQIKNNHSSSSAKIKLIIKVFYVAAAAF